MVYLIVLIVAIVIAIAVLIQHSRKARRYADLPERAEEDGHPTPAAPPHAADVEPERPYTGAHAPLSTGTELIPPFQEGRCCICNEPLGEEYAILFRTGAGAEARIDRKCYGKLYTLSQGRGTQEIVKAGRYIMSRYGAVDPRVEEHLKKYVRLAAGRLSEQDGGRG